MPNLYFLLRSISVAIISVTVSIAQAQVLWNGTRYGMTTDQVIKIVKLAKTPDSPNVWGDGARELLRIEEIKIVNNNFYASFFFLKGRLTQVTLSIENAGSFEDAIRVFNSLTEVLRVKYGAEMMRNVKRGTLNTADAEWMSGRTNINVSALSVGDNLASLNVNYQVRIATEADKL